jgi:hypothetical protein
MRKCWLRFEVFLCAFIVASANGVSASDAATSKYTKPSTPTNLSATGGLENAYLYWKAPISNGGQKITSYRVRILESQTFYTCKSSATSCTVPINNPNKPSAKPAPLWFSFTVAATNSIGTGPDSSVGHSRVQVRFRATLVLSNKFAPPTPKVTPTPTPKVTPTPTPTPTPTLKPTQTPTPTPTSVPTPTPKATPSVSATGITAFDGTYTGSTVVSVYSGGSQTPALVTPVSITFVVLNGAGSGTTNDWTVTGQVIDAKGVATITASNSMYGSFTFSATFAVDGATKLMGGAGTGSQTLVIPTLGELRVEYSFNVRRQS